ncbi:toluene tolerance protein [Stutzerimonas decontaminans]|uniref:Toluene tolerance protein n=2 Tax=Stutzerimonas TaxID=2901164 RepID=A0ABX4W2K9_9GAMM|nr:lipopolysaccharide kinase InaA family protein [Stutzerimonas decontaminans]AHY41307.1 toluene tolerance protein [Stutzerimonas decontaminans]MCQ4247428.1 toluene tolerance protein [Stutzerimonas decontaminans]PNF85567.1 toluene tolerance protein [Stutzerimonas decontaminans]
MRIVTAQELESWLASGDVLERDGRGPKVVALSNGLYLKIFHTRRASWLARLRPAAIRFARNAQTLAAHGIATPEITETFWLDRDIGLSGCLYRPLPGHSLEGLFRESPETLIAKLPELASFIRKLHEHKIYFRSLHIGNILLLPTGRFGLIDFLDLQQKLLPLNSWQIRRNLRHMQNHLARKKLGSFPFEALQSFYYNKDVHAHPQKSHRPKT